MSYSCRKIQRCTCLDGIYLQKLREIEEGLQDAQGLIQDNGILEVQMLRKNWLQAINRVLHWSHQIRQEWSWPEMLAKLSSYAYWPAQSFEANAIVVKDVSTNKSLDQALDVDQYWSACHEESRAWRGGGKADQGYPNHREMERFGSKSANWISDRREVQLCNMHGDSTLLQQSNNHLRWDNQRKQISYRQLFKKG